jgi:pyruvate,water dikinase
MIGKLGNIDGLPKSELGGKAYSLDCLTKNRARVPAGFVVYSSCFINCLKENGVLDEIQTSCNIVSFDNVFTLYQKLKDLVLKCEIGKSLENEIKERLGELNGFVSVRSSAASEDGEHHTFAGLHDSFLNTERNYASVSDAVRKCWASLFNERAMLYRIKKKIPLFEGMAVVVQQMVKAICAGVVYTRHPIEREFLLVESAFGLGDSVVDGVIKPDSYMIRREPLEISTKELGTKKTRTDYKDGVHAVSVNSNSNRNSFTLNDDVLLELASSSMEIEEIFKKTQDIEWAYDGELWFLQSRSVNF